MTITQKISAAILARIAAGQSVRQAFDAVLGAGAFDRLAGSLWDEFRKAT